MIRFSLIRIPLIRFGLSLLALLGVALSSPALAWGPVGHRTIADIAMANVKPGTRAKIAALIAHEAELGTADCAVKSLEDASTWPDCVRGPNENWRWGYTFPWHFQDEPICGSFDLKSDCANGECVTVQIERNRRILADPALPAAQRLEALIFLAHFVEDIHQPLHMADHGDKGGNDVTVANIPPEPGSLYPTVSLHWFWDKIMAERAIASAPTPLVRAYSPEEKAKLGGGTVADWARESYDMARAVVYPMAFKKDPCAGETPKSVTITEAEAAPALPATRLRLVQAGLRLARMLDESLSPAG
jgi:hypothetical protein